VVIQMIVLLMMVAVLHVMTVNLISQLTDLNAVIPHGMSLVLTVLTLMPTITGIVLVVHALVMKKVNVVMATAISMKTAKPVKLIAAYAVNVMQVL